MVFKRKKTDAAPPLPGPLPTASAPDRPPMPVAAAPDETAAEPRTTCYPQDAEAPPPVLGQPRTTVYRQSVRWNRGGYDTTN